LIGLIDIILVVVSAVRINSADPTQLRALTYLPLSLLPTFLVPLIIATHIMIFARLLRR
jgi:preprotein translocase subunit SecY